MRILSSVILIVFAAASVSTHAQKIYLQSGCEAPPKVRAAIDGPLSQDSLAKLKSKDRDAVQKQVLDNLLAKYPREYSLYVQQMYSVWALRSEDAKTATEQLRARWVNNAKEHPDDPLALLLAGKILMGKDTPEAVRLLEASSAKAPQYPWPAHELAELYSRGKYENETKMKENLEKFYSLCPAWTANDFYSNQREGFLLRKDMPLVAKTAVALRAKLEKETDPKQLEKYKILWQREFLTRPPNEHEAVRAQIRLDLKRLEARVPHGDADWRVFLIDGYRQSGASNEQLAQMQDAAARDFPHGAPADGKSWVQWDKEHPLPDGQKDAEAWKSYYAAKIEFVKARIQEFPDDLNAQRVVYFMVAKDDEYVSKEDGLAALDRYLQAMEDYGGYGTMSFGPSDSAKFLLDHGWQPERALDLLKKSLTYKGGGHSNVDWTDDLTDNDLQRLKRYVAYDDLETIGLILKAASLAGKPDEALKFRSVIEEPPPADKRALEQYWTNRARLAVIEKHPQDALVYYRLALDSRSKQPEYHHGILRDDLTTEFHELWTSQGGTDAAWMAWNTPAPAEKSEAEMTQPTGKKDKAEPAKESTTSEKKKKEPQGDWADAPKDLPSFELSDFSGKTWRLKDLTGKVVMITSWATWCGPCGMEDKALQKFYDKVKDREDLLILTFNVDENPGMVLPFMQKQGYTFPVLAAFSLPEKMRDLVPRTWIIDPNGHWRWVKNGYDDAQSYAEFEKEMLDRIERAKAGL